MAGSVDPTPDLTPYVPRVLQRRPAHAPRHWTTEATAVFIDISGFTSLSEQLARRGRVGAEDLVSTLSRIFTLLMSATDDGGDVVKFAGDALLVMYTGPDHQRHACHAAAQAQRLLAVVGDVRLADAHERLRMSVGVHGGPFHLVLTGRDSQGLVITGPTLDRVLALQDLAQPGQVLVSAEVAETLPPGARGAAVGDGVLLRRPPQVASVGQDGTTLGSSGTVGDLTRYLPAAFAQRPDLLAADSDHRRAAMAFVQVSGLGSHLDDPLAVVDPLTDVVEEACRQTGATLLDVDIARDGYRYFLTAGAPVGLEDPEGRLLSALLRITAADTPLSVRAGASTGQVFAGPVGPSFRRTFSVMGDTTNLAARLTARAPAGRVLVHQAVTRRSATAFAETAHDPVTVKGQSTPIAVSVVTDVLGLREATEGADPPFVGRESEVDLLSAVLERTAQGTGGVVEVVGAAGAGKTRLVAEATARVPRRTVRVTADPYGAQVPYRTVGLLLRALLGLTRSDSPTTTAERLTGAVARVAPRAVPWVPLLGTVLAVDLPTTPEVADLDDRFRAARLHAALGELLAGLLDRPTVVVVDHAQWVDPTSVAALAALRPVVVDRGCALVVVGRDLPTVDPRATRITLGPLSPAAATRLVTALGGAPSAGRGGDGPGGDARGGSEVRSIVRRADGNPYLLVQLASAAGHGELPDTVEELVGTRIDDLSGHDRDVLRQAAVLGSRFTLRLFTETTGLPDLAGSVAGSVAGSGLGAFLSVEPDATVAFRRELEREVAYGQLTFRRRREVHRRAAAAIETTPDLVDAAARLALLSLHSTQAGEWSAAFDWSRRAAEEAQAHDALEEAAGFARRALEAGRRSGAPAEDLSRVEERLGDVLGLAGRHEAADQALRNARRATRDPLRVAELTYKAGTVRRESGRLDAALAAARQVARLAADLPAPRGEELLVEADLLRAGVRYWQGRGEQSRRLAASAADRSARLPEGAARTRLLARAWSLHDTAVVELEGRAGEHGEAPLEMFRAVGDLYHEGRFAGNVGLGEYYEGHWDAAVRLYRRSLGIAQRIGDVFGVAVAKMNIGEVLSLQGDTHEATSVLAESVAELRDLHVPIATAHAALYLSVARRLAGDLSGSRRHLEESAVLFAEAGRDSGSSLDEHASRSTELLVAEGAYGEARAAATALLDRDEALAALHRARLLRSRAVAARALGETDTARADLDASLAVARGLPLGYDAALGLLLLADWTGEVAARAEAATILEGLGAGALVPRA